MGVNVNAASTQEAGLVGMGYYTGVFGVAYGATTQSPGASVQYNSGTGGHVQGQTDGLDAQTVLGTGVFRPGRHRRGRQHQRFRPESACWPRIPFRRHGPASPGRGAL